MNDRDTWTLKAMTRYGGGFVHALAQAAYQADQHNLAKIKVAFSGYWEQYEGMGKKLEEADKK